MTSTTLAVIEAALLAPITEGVDEPGSGWLHEVEPFNYDHVAAGVLGALMLKGPVTSSEMESEPGKPPCF
jgi:hypothetical protein